MGNCPVCRNENAVQDAVASNLGKFFEILLLSLTTLASFHSFFYISLLRN